MLLESVDFAVDFLNLFFQGAFLDKVDEEENDRQKPDPEAAYLLFEGGFLLLELCHLLLDALLFADNPFGCLAVIVEEDFGLVLPCVG